MPVYSTGTSTGSSNPYGGFGSYGGRGSSGWLEDQRRQRQQTRQGYTPPPSTTPTRDVPPPSTAPGPPPPSTGTAPVPDPNDPTNRKAFYDAMLAQRGRGLEYLAQAQRQTGLQALEGRGLGQSSVVGATLADINRNEAIGYQNASSDIYGQQFQASEQRAAEDRQRQHDVEMENLRFQHQAALAKFAKKRSGGFWGKFLGIAGGVVGGLLGGPAGAAAGYSIGSGVGGSDAGSEDTSGNYA